MTAVFNTIEDRIRTRDNNFSLLRLIAASLVIFSHCYPLAGSVSAEPLARLTGILDLSTAAVICFFVISGFLVTQSAVNSRSMLAFAIARFLRIAPGLAFVAMVTTLIIGPLASSYGAKEYFSASNTWRYLIKTPLLDVGRYLPGVFEKNPLPFGVNGSLWTIQIEVWLYTVVAILALLQAFRYRLIFLCITGTAFLLFSISVESVMHFYPRSDVYMTTRLIACFFIGATFYVFRSWLYLSPIIGMALIVLSWFSWNTAYFGYSFYLTFAYWTILIAFSPSNYLSRFFDRLDLSYGLYIFGFPVQQLIVSFYAPVSPTELFFASYPIVILLSLFSWYFVESKALRLKGTLNFPISRTHFSKGLS